ncbi:hypothetical protein GGR50DRAFT_693894 [Xylaria sp. CBS 124048]|nr:hypothetical protein GGR50DRAFT_693894 [Xylaria sp. CBS 124048]
MLPKKNLATAKSNSVDDDPSVHTDPDSRPGQSPTTSSAESSHRRRRSQSPSRSESHNHTPASCVSRNYISGENCARQRFILWAAVERNSSVHMAASERLRCPLLRCGERFEEHEEMLKHLTQCRHLSTGEYLCYECMRVERFNDKNCTGSIAQPTKRKRIISMAKSFFSNISSAKGWRDTPRPSNHNAQPCPPMSYSPNVDGGEPYNKAQVEQPVQQEESHQEMEPFARNQPELNGTEMLLELDSTPLPPTTELDTVNHNAPYPTATSSPQEPCVKAKAPSTPIPNFTLDPPSPPSFSTVRRSDGGSSGSNGSRRPSLALDTKIDRYRTKSYTKHLSPSASLPFGSHGISPITPWSTGSGSSPMWSPVFSQDAMLASPITPLSADTYPEAPQEHHMFSTEKDMERSTCPEDPYHYKRKSVPNFIGDKQLPSQLLSDPLMFSYDPKDGYSWIFSMDTEMSLGTSVNMMFTDPTAKTDIPSDFLGAQIPGLEIKALIERVWDSLGQQFSSSVSKLSRLQNNSLADNFRTQALGAVVSVGLTRLKSFVNHNYHTRQDPIEYLCFIHLINSISLVSHEDGLMTRSNKIYEQAMAYSERFGTIYRDDYCQIVRALWHQNPQESTSRGRIPYSASWSAGSKGKELDGQVSRMAIANPDPLVIMGQDFLDELESIVVKSDTQHPIEVLSSDVWASHLSSNQPHSSGDTPLTIASSYLVQELCRRYHDSDSLLGKLKAIGQNARTGYYPSIRKLELELIQTGKNYFSSYDFRGRYNLEVRSLCDEIYSQSGTRRRAEYHLLGISLTESLFRSASRLPQQPQGGHTEYPMIPYQYEEEFLRDLNKSLSWSYPMLPITQPPMHTSGITDFSPSLDLTGLHSMGSHTQQITGSPSHLPVRGDASETHSESYAVSPAPLSDALPEITTTPHSYRPTAPFKDQGEGSDTSCPSTLVSSGAKVEASERCEICGYRPKGDPQWFKGSMAKHKKMQHSTNPPIIYKCPFPGCNSEYKNRRDNLRQHQIEKNHFVGDEARRPLKRKRNHDT